MNQVQKNYMKAKAELKAVEAKIRKIEQDYIALHNIVNEDGTIPAVSYAIENDVVFEKMLADTAPELDKLKSWEAREALLRAEDDLIMFGLDMIKSKRDDLPGHDSVQSKLIGRSAIIRLREEWIALTLKLTA